MVAEVFSPPRFAPHAESPVFSTRSYDLKTGFDFCKAATRQQVREELRQSPPELLFLCPLCTNEGGWFHLNVAYMDPQEVATKLAQSRMFIRFCCQLFRQQVRAGKRAVFEHPKGSRLWTYPEVQALCQEHELVTCHMCRYGLHLPGSKQLIRKSTNLLVSHEDMKCLGKRCPGANHSRHACHQIIAGSAPGVGSISVFAGQYTPQFVQAVLQTVPTFQQYEAASLVECEVGTSAQRHEVLMARQDLEAEGASDEQVMKVLDRLHRNLGHPPSHDLVRILKHAQASERAITLSRKYERNSAKHTLDRMSHCQQRPVA